MQSTDDIQAKTLKKKPKPNNKTKTLSKRRPGEDFKSRSCSLNRKFDCTERNTHKTIEISDSVANKAKNFQETIQQEANITHDNTITDFNSPLVENTVGNLGKEMSAKTNLNTNMSREEILAARQNKKNAKKGKSINENSLNATNGQNKFSEESDKKTISSNEKSVLHQISSVKGGLENTEDSEIKKNVKNIGISKINANAAEEIVDSDINKSREQVMAERQAKKLAKQIKKNIKSDIKPAETNAISKDCTAGNTTTSNSLIEGIKNKDRNETTERKGKNSEQIIVGNASEESNSKTVLPTDNRHVIVTEKKQLSKAERRAIQEAQRAAKTKMLEEKQKSQKKTCETVKKSSEDVKSAKNVSNVQQSDQKVSPKIRSFTSEYKVKLFKHLDREDLQEKNQFINHPNIHPSIVQLGEQISTRTVVGSNARCISFLKALKIVIQDYQTPPKKEFTRELEDSINNCVQYLGKCRPLAVSVSNAHKTIQSVLRHLSNDSPESELKETLCEHIDTYIRDQIEKAAQAISVFVQQKISEGDVILTYNCSSLIYQILEDAYNRKIDFRVIVVDSRPFLEGRELFRKLILKEIPCTYVLINAIGFIMPEVTKILMGAHALLANGNVMARTGTAQIALVAKSFNVPVLVCCETHKFSDRVQTDAIVYNELGNPDDLIMNETCKLSNWRKGANKILPLNLNYDITPPELVTAVVTEVAILPCTSVPVILRLRPTDLY